MKQQKRKVKVRHCYIVVVHQEMETLFFGPFMTVTDANVWLDTSPFRLIDARVEIVTKHEE